ncbi:MAG: hypothetical protein DRJ51_07160 [Thermoprotei archaeon]|nr:MAG: hypothetical protein DRJ51_07160 [Thermoprotei archaeon]
MAELDVLKIYDKFGNLFKFNCRIGKLYQVPDELEKEIDKTKTIYVNGTYYSYERISSIEVEPTLEMIKRILVKQFCLTLKNNGYEFKGKYLVYSKSKEIDHPHRDIFSVFDGFEFRIMIVQSEPVLCINPHLIFRVNCSIQDLIERGVDIAKLSDFSVSYKGENSYGVDGYLIETLIERDSRTSFLCRIKDYREFTEELVPADRVRPEPRPELIQYLLRCLNIEFDVIKMQREYSFLESKTASKDRFLKTLKIVKELKKLFPIKFGDFEVDIQTEPIIVKV